MWGQGTVLNNRYRLVERIGVGSMGDVWRAEDVALRREVAVKILLPALLEDSGFAERFLVEARVLAALNHPGIVSVHDYGETSDPRAAFLVMELIDGRPLSLVMAEEEQLDPARTLTIVAQTLDALQAAHDKGVVHRDVKPANLLLRGGAVVVTDFGVARTVGARRLTAKDTVLGTAVYGAPEQAKQGAVTSAADQYSVGVIAYECLCGLPPFDGESSLAIMMKHVQEPVPPLPVEIPVPVRELVERALAKDPQDRFADATQMADAARAALAQLGDDAPQEGPRVLGARAGATRDWVSFRTGIPPIAEVAAPTPDEDSGEEAGPDAPTAETAEVATAPLPASPEEPGQAVTAQAPRSQGEEEGAPPPAARTEMPDSPGWASYTVRPGETPGAAADEDVPDWASFRIVTEREAAPREAGPEPSVAGRQALQNSQTVLTAHTAQAEETEQTLQASQGAESEYEARGDDWANERQPVGGAAEAHATAPTEPLDDPDPWDPGPTVVVVETAASRTERSTPPPGGGGPAPASPGGPGKRRQHTAVVVGAAVALAIGIAATVALTTSGSGARAAMPPPPSAGAALATTRPAVVPLPASPSLSPSPSRSASPSAKAATPTNTAQAHGSRSSAAASSGHSSASAASTTAAASTVPPSPHVADLITNVTDGLSVDVVGGNSADGTQLIAWHTYPTLTGQHWTQVETTINGVTGFYFEDHLNTSEVIDMNANTEVTLWMYHSGLNQLWQAQSSAVSGAYYLRNAGTGGCLTDNGLEVQVSVTTCNSGDSAQEWYLP